MKTTMQALAIHNLSFTYAGATQPAFSSLDLTLEQGEFALLTGSTASGKTTLLSLVKPELTPAGIKTGSIQVFGHESSNLNPKTSATTIGFVAQNCDAQIICDNVWHELAFGLENLGLSSQVIRRRIAEVAAFFGLEKYMHTKTVHLSGGEKQLVALASILVMQPKLILLDEPTAQLDPIAEKNLLHALFRINRELNTTIFLASHNPEQILPYATSQYALRDFPCKTVLIPEISPSAQVSASKKQEPIVELRNTAFRYQREASWILQSINLSIWRGEIHALVGGNGSGKTTLLRLISNILRPQLGKLRNSMLSSQAYLPQDPKTLFTGDTVREELEEWQLTCSYTEEEIQTALLHSELELYEDQHPYDLSGGQQQNLALVKLLLTKPQLLLLDEPTKGLDLESKRRLATLLKSHQQKGSTIVISTHDLSFVEQLATTVSMLFDAHIISTEPTSEFFEKNLFYKTTASPPVSSKPEASQGIQPQTLKGELVDLSAERIEADDSVWRFDSSPPQNIRSLPNASSGVSEK